jgi:redox-sensitive bicupin YhaK (pirin superfamily)
MSNVVRQTVPIGFQWPTIDPFLFCVHHDDDYPPGNDHLGPAASLEGRQLGQDFEGLDGWRMYHGHEVPGFPQHPHRGFETVTFVRRGLIDHSDSLGAAARFGRGDVQWLTAGAGIVHAETFPLVERDGPNPTELFQIWLNLPPEDKLAAPHFSMLWSEDIPQLQPADGVTVTVIAGELDGATPPPPPPHSWASGADSDVAIWHVVLEPGASWTLPPARHADTVRTLYCFDGEGLTIGSMTVEGSTASVLDPSVAVELTATAHVECLVLQGRPIGAPVAQYGPFVMNTEAEIRQAFEDYRRTEFGGWPWPSDEPVSAADQPRFARHPDGRIEQPGSAQPEAAQTGRGTSNVPESSSP